MINVGDNIQYKIVVKNDSNDIGAEISLDLSISNEEERCLRWHFEIR